MAFVVKLSDGKKQAEKDRRLAFKVHLLLREEIKCSLLNLCLILKQWKIEE